MVEGLLRELGFEIEPTINYDPRQVISNRRKAQKRNTFKHKQVVGLVEAANWSNYPKEAPNIVDLDEYPSSHIGQFVSLLPDISNLVVAAKSITPLSSQSKGKNKRDFPEAMDIDEEDTAKNPKRYRIENEG